MRTFRRDEGRQARGAIFTVGFYPKVTADIITAAPVKQITIKLFSKLVLGGKWYFGEEAADFSIAWRRRN